jgi:hypothetical protein
MHLRPVLVAVYASALAILCLGVSAEAQKGTSIGTGSAWEGTPGGCTRPEDCMPCVQTCLSLPGQQPRCVPSGMHQCRDGRCVNYNDDCSCNPTCKPCEERCNAATRTCERTEFALCPTTGECRDRSVGVCSDTCNPPCNCKQFCAQGMLWNYCNSIPILENHEPCPDGTCVNPDEGESCNGTCPNGPCAYCTQKCVEGSCQDTLNHICPDGSCRGMTEGCPKIRTRVE